MRVIKKGRPQKAPAQELECTGKGNGYGGCGALLLVEETDIFRTSSSAMGEVTHYKTFQCPDCKTWTDYSGKLKARCERKPCYRCNRIDCGCNDE